LGVEQILGRFIDASYAYRFGPPGHDLIVASLHPEQGDCAFAQSFRFPTGRSARCLPISEFGIVARSFARRDGAVEVHLGARRFVNGARIAAENALPDDCYFGIEPGGERSVVLKPVNPGEPLKGLALTAINAVGRIPITVERAA
jgi:beta-mannosidase